MSKKIRKMWNKLSDSYILLNSVPLFFQADDTLGGRWWVGRVFERLSLLSPLPPHSCVVVMFLGGCVICSRGGGEKEEEEKVEEEHSFPPILSEFLSAHTHYPISFSRSIWFGKGPLLQCFKREKALWSSQFPSRYFLFSEIILDFKNQFLGEVGGKRGKLGWKKGENKKRFFLLPNLSWAVCTVKSLRKTGKGGEGRREKKSFCTFLSFLKTSNRTICSAHTLATYWVWGGERRRKKSKHFLPKSMGKRRRRDTFHPSFLAISAENGGGWA